MRHLAGPYDRVVTALAVIAGIIPLFLLFGTILSVAIRMAGQQFWPWLQAYIEYGLLYCTLLAAPWLVRQHGHVKVDAFVNMIPTGPRRLIACVILAICILVALIFTFYSGTMFFEAARTGNYETKSVDMPLWLLYLPMVVAFPLMAIEFIRLLVAQTSQPAATVSLPEGP